MSIEDFKKNWEINENWQLIFPVIGILGLLFSSYRLISLFNLNSIILVIILALILASVLLKITLYLFKKLEKKWAVEQRWEIIRIFIVFAITGSSSAFFGRPLLKLIGITKENLNIYLYWFLFIFVSLLIYQVLLVFFGWALGQFKFFWEFEKKMLRRFGLKRFLD